MTTAYPSLLPLRRWAGGRSQSLSNSSLPTIIAFTCLRRATKVARGSSSLDASVLALSAMRYSAIEHRDTAF